MFPFVRAGAVVACERCGKVYGIEPGQAERVGGAASASAGLFEAGGGSDAAGGGPGSLGDRVSGGPGHPAVAGGAAAAPPSTQPAGNPAAQPAAPAAEPPGRPADLRPPPTPRRLRVAAWAVGLVAAATLLALGVWGTRPAPPPPTPREAPARSDAADMANPGDAQAASTLATDLPVLFATRLTAHGWVIFGSPQPGAGVVEAGRPAEAALESPDPDRWLVRMELPASGEAVVEQAVVALDLVDPQGRVHAQTRCEAALLMSASARRLWVEVPAPLASRGLIPRAAVVQEQAMAGGTPVPASVEARPLGRAIGLRVRGELPAGVSAKRVVFVIRASDEAGRTVAEWRCDWDQPVGSGGAVRFQAVVSPGRTQGLSWSVRAAAAVGEPGGAGAAP